MRNVNKKRVFFLFLFVGTIVALFVFISKRSVTSTDFLFDVIGKLEQKDNVFSWERYLVFISLDKRENRWEAIVKRSEIKTVKRAEVFRSFVQGSDDIFSLSKVPKSAYWDFEKDEPKSASNVFEAMRIALCFYREMNGDAVSIRSLSVSKVSVSKVDYWAVHIRRNTNLIIDTCPIYILDKKGDS